MKSVKKSFNLLLSLAALVAFSQLVAQPTQAIWTFDASPPVSVITQSPISVTNNAASLRVNIYEVDNFSFDPTGKVFYLYFSDKNSIPTISFSELANNFSKYECTSPKVDLRKVPDDGTYVPCFKKFFDTSTSLTFISPSNYTNSAQGYLKASYATPTGSSIPLDNELSRYYISTAINQDNAGNSGIWTPPVIANTTRTTNANPFIQTTQGDVHSNESISPKSSASP